MWSCEDCPKKGRAGNVIREYDILTPVAITTVRLCFACFQKHDKKNQRRKHIFIVDKNHV